MSPKSETATTSNPFPGRPMIYHPLLQNLELEKTYGHHAVVNHGETCGLFEKEPLKSKGSPSKALISLSGFADRNLGAPDRTIKVSKKRTLKEWYGWRWKRTLPRDCCGEEEWREIERLEKRHERRRVLWTKISGLWTKIKSRKLAICTLLVVVFGIAAAKHFRPVEMWRVLLTEGPGAALQWLKDPQTPREKFIRAYGLYSSGNFEEAFRITNSLMSVKAEPKLRGDVYYLAAELARRSHQDNTLELYQDAVTNYLEVNAFNSIHLAYTSMAKFLIDLDDPSLAVNHLDFAKTLPATKPNLAYFHEVESELYFKVGNYQQALNASKMSLNYYEGVDINGTARMLSNVGFYEMLLGNFEKGLAKTVESEVIILKTGKMKLYFYNKLNLMLFLKCSGFSHHSVEGTIKDYAENERDLVLEGYLAFLENYSCERLRLKGDGESPPPPPDQQ